MIGKTTETAIQALIFLAVRPAAEPVSPRAIAEALGASPTYMAKITNLLVKAGTLRAHRGAQGGVTLARPAQDINLLMIVEACQGRIVGDYCPAATPLRKACAYHQVMFEVHQAITTTLSRWTLADLARQPKPDWNQTTAEVCRMANIYRNWKK